MAIAVLLGGTAAAQAEGLASREGERPWRLSVRSVHHADALALRDMGNDEAVGRLDPRSGRNIAYVDDEARIERQWGAWRVGLLARARATLVANGEALSLARELDRDTRSGESARWPVRLRYDGFQGAGLAVQREFAPAPGWTASLQVQGLQLRHWRQRRLDGSVGFDAPTQTYAFGLRSMGSDDRMALPFGGGGAASHGHGLLLGGEIAWRGVAWNAAIGVSDLGVLRWKRRVREDATLSSDTRTVDADGFVVYKPLVQGQFAQAGGSQRLRGRASTRIGIAVGASDELFAAGQWVPGFGVLPAVGWEGRRGAWALGMQWHLHERRVGIDIGWRAWRLRLGADSARRSREWGVSAGWAL